MSENYTISWIVSANEKKIRRNMALLISMPFLICLFIIAIIGSYIEIRGEQDFFYSFSGVNIEGFDYKNFLIIGIPVLLIIFVLVYIFNKIYSFKNREYSLNEKSVGILEKDKKFNYVWNDFDYFFEYNFLGTSYSNSYFLDKIFNKTKEKQIEATGKVFYLKLKPKNIISKIINKIVVIYTNPENYSKVHKKLSEKLIEKKNFELIRPVKYYFK